MRSIPVILTKGLILFLLSLFLMACSDGKANGTGDIDQSVPEATVRNWYRAINDKNPELLKSLVDQSDDSNRVVLQAYEALLASDVTVKTDNLEIYTVENDGQIARIRAIFQVTITQEDGSIVSEMTGYMFSLTKKNGKWYLIGLGQPIPPGWERKR